MTHIVPDSLAQIIEDFAAGIQEVDRLGPVAVNQRSGVAFQPGIGPHTETLTVRLVYEHIGYDSYRLGVPYGDGSKQACDVCIGSPDSWSWAVEVKMLRLMGDNGKPNDNILMHILSPYPAHRSALTDCEKLVGSTLAPRKAIMIYGYDYDRWPMDPVIDAFETLARERVDLGGRVTASFGGLIHLVHREGRVFGWELRKQP
jgi:hypothetical protein